MKTETEKDIRIHKEIDGGCWHEWERFVTNADSFDLYNSYDYKCEKCGAARRPIGWKQPSYHTPDGNQLIKAWLVKEGRWYDDFLNCIVPDNVLVECKEIFADTLTDPKQFAQKFYEYIERED